MKQYMNWSFRMDTTTNKLPSNWFKQRCNMAYRIAYLLKAYIIPPTLIVNNDQASVHFDPTMRKRTWESKGSKHIQVLEVEDKWQITMVIFSTTNDFLFPPQIIFIGIIHHFFPPFNEGVKNAWVQVGILHLVKTIGQHWKQQSNSSIRFCCHICTFKFAS